MEVREDIHVYLNSRLNVREYPSNSSNGFTNVIKPGLALDSTYEVALENIIFEPDIYTIGEGDEKYMVDVRVTYNKEDGGSGFYLIRYLPTTNIKAENVYELIHFLDRDITKFLIKERFIKEDQGYIFRMITNDSIDFKEFNLMQYHETYEVKLSLGEGFAEVMGIVDRTFTGKPEWLVSPIYPRKISCIYVYCDIIELTFLGQQTVHFLDVIAMPHMHCKQGNLMIYKRVNKSVINNISIRLTDEKGEKIRFEDHVSVTGVLHFRRI